LGRPFRIGIVGLGKIARDQHLPAIADNRQFVLAATASPEGALIGIPAYESLGELVAAGGVDAVAICTPPGPRHALAREAIGAGLHVLLEKPPAATLSEARDIAADAAAQGVTAFAAWHSREAAGVAAAKAWLSGRRIKSIDITWHEDIRRWHPGQEWILAAGGFGVFDPAINALSILTEIVSQAIVVERAVFHTPENRQAPIAAELSMRLASGAAAKADFNFLQTGDQTWTIEISTDGGPMRLTDGGSQLLVRGRETPGENREYAGLYNRFADLIASGRSDIDTRPLELVADAFLVAERRRMAAFDF